MAEKSNRIYLLEEAGVASALLKLGIPTMVGMLISALYNAIDAYFVGGLGSRIRCIPDCADHYRSGDDVWGRSIFLYLPAAWEGGQCGGQSNRIHRPVRQHLCRGGNHYRNYGVP